MHGSRSKIPSKKSRPYIHIYDVKFLALLGAPYIHDISRLRVNELRGVQRLVLGIAVYILMFINNQNIRLFLAVDYFIQPLLHVSTRAFRHQRTPSVPVELHANRMQWLIRLHVLRCYVSVMWRAGMHRSVWLCCRVITHLAT
jgi:hypothetical protein